MFRNLILVLAAYILSKLFDMLIFTYANVQGNVWKWLIDFALFAFWFILLSLVFKGGRQQREIRPS